MSKKPIEITIDAFEKLAAQVYHQNKVRTVRQIVFDPLYYNLVSVEHDNFFTLKVMSNSLKVIHELIDYFESKSFRVLGDMDILGQERLISIYENSHNLNENGKIALVEMKKTFVEQKRSMNRYGVIGVDAPIYYFYLLPVNHLVNQLSLFLVQNWNEIIATSKHYDSFVAMEFNQLDKVIEGLILFNVNDANNTEMEGISSDIRVNITMGSVRQMYIGATMIQGIADTQEEFDKLGAKIILSRKKTDNSNNLPIIDFRINKNKRVGKIR